MKALVGKKLAIKVQDMDALVRGVVAKVTNDRAEVVCDGVDGPKVFTIVLNKVVMYSVEGDGGYTPIHLLGCQNPAINCRGVRFFLCGKQEPEAKDFEVFMSLCPSRCETCAKGDMGDLYKVPYKNLAGLLGETVFGDYPEPSKEPDNDEQRTTGEASE